MTREGVLAERVRATAVLLFGLAVAAGAGAAGAAAQSPPPDGSWRTFETEHFRVTYGAGLEPLARRAADVAERTHAVLRRDLAEPPEGVIDLVVTDHVDFSNGYATPQPSNRIVVFARPPLELSGLAFSRSWIDLVVAHELVHVFHFDRTGPVGDALRTVFGRLPLPWPVFPVVGTPAWNVEGLATHYESRLTGAGRVYGSFHDMVIRTAALEDHIPDLGEVNALSPVWPGGHRAYVYGSAFMDWIAREYGPDAHARLIDATAGAVLPPFLFFDRIARPPLGARFHDLYRAWRRSAADSARSVRDRVLGDGVTRTTPVAGRGPFAVAPRVSPDGRSLAYSADDYRSRPATRILDLSTGETRTLRRRNQAGELLGPASWLPDGSGVVVAQLEYRGPYRLWSDLWMVSSRGEERRLTRGERLTQPAVAPDGRRVAAVQDHGGALRLVVHDRSSGGTRVLVEAAPGEGFDLPRWSPDGRHLAVARFHAGRLDLVLVDAGTGAVTPLTEDDAVDRAPAWTPDGRWVLFSSDRTGIPNLFAIAVDPPAPEGAGSPAVSGERADGRHGGRRVRQVTNVLTGAFDPEVSPDGATLFFSAYHHDGWHVERLPLDTTRWRAAAPPALRYRDGELYGPGLPLPGPGAPAASGDTGPPAAVPPVGGPSRAYSALATVRPYFWMPLYRGVGGTARLRFLGLQSFGWDVLQRDQWWAGAGVDVETGRTLADVSWTWRGLGTPVLTLSARRDWAGTGAAIVLPDSSTDAIVRREDRVALDALLLRRRWRGTQWLRASAEAEWREYQARTLTDEEVLAAGYVLGRAADIGVSVSPGISTADLFPYSISYEDGITASVAVGRWWDADTGGRAYDELTGRGSGYLGIDVGGFARHVLAVRGAGLRRDGPDAAVTGIGGAPGVLSTSLGTVATGVGTLLPVRGFDDGVRVGTRAWSASAEYRFPIHMPGLPPRAPGPVAPDRGFLGLSVTSLYGAVFVDGGDAWCPASFTVHPCSTGGPVASVGGEVGVTTGVLDNLLVQIRLGAAIPIRGEGSRLVPYLAFGPSF